MGTESDRSNAHQPKKLSPEYLAFMRSDEWRDIRAEALRLYGRRCAGCMAGEAIHMHHLFYPRVLAATCAKHILPLCEGCHTQAHSQRLFHPTVFDEAQCGEKRRQTIVYLQAVQTARRERSGRMRKENDRRNRNRPKEQPSAKLEKFISRWQPLRPRQTKSHNFMTHAEYLQKMPAPQ